MKKFFVIAICLFGFNFISYSQEVIYDYLVENTQNKDFPLKYKEIEGEGMNLRKIPNTSYYALTITIADVKLNCSFKYHSFDEEMNAYIYVGEVDLGSAADVFYFGTNYGKQPFKGNIVIASSKKISSYLNKYEMLKSINANLSRYFPCSFKHVFMLAIEGNFAGDYEEFKISRRFTIYPTKDLNKYE